jgi:hypothetical protein
LRTRLFPLLALIDFLKSLLQVQLLHLFFEHLFVLLELLLLKSILSSFLSFLRVNAVLVLLLSLHNTLLSLLFFGLIIGSLFEFFELTLHKLISLHHKSIVKACVCVVYLTHRFKS